MENKKNEVYRGNYIMVIEKMREVFKSLLGIIPRPYGSKPYALDIIFREFHLSEKFISMSYPVPLGRGHWFSR